MPATGDVADLGVQHAVTFFDKDDDLLEVLGPFLLSAHAEDTVAIAVATAAHATALQAMLAAAGVDVALARATGGLIIADAQLTLDQFMLNGHLDSAAFDLSIGGLVRQAGSTGRPVAVFGEMVGLLWAAGLVTAALEVEAAWAELQAESTFALLCGYPTGPAVDEGGSSRPTTADPTAEICRVHSAVLGIPPADRASETTPAVVEGDPAVIERAFAGSPESAGAARRFVADTLREWGVDDRADDLELVVTELATNAIKHAGSAFNVQLSCSPDAVRVAVTDSSPDPPVPRAGSVLSTSGRGLLLVSAIADRWGSEPAGAGKAVWAELWR